MSYILDALKKSERQRQRGAVPGVTTVQEVTVPEPKDRLLWPYVVIGALLLIAGLFVWRSMSFQSKKPVKIEQAVVEKQNEQARTPAPATPIVAPDEKKETHKDAAPVSKQVSKSAEVPSPAPKVEQPVVPTKAVVEKVPAVAPVVRQEPVAQAPAQPAAVQPASEQKPAEAVIPPPENRIYNMTELPAALRESIPQLNISTHIHSGDPSSRLVRINGQTLREGQDVAAGLKLEEITSDGIILRYHGYRFRLGVR